MRQLQETVIPVVGEQSDCVTLRWMWHAHRQRCCVHSHDKKYPTNINISLL